MDPSGCHIRWSHTAALSRRTALSTNENAICRYATSANTSYSAMPGLFATTGATAHSTPAGGLANGTTYTFYVRCADAIGNANFNDFVITFSVAAATGSGLVAAYGFNENGGTTIADLSGNGHSGAVSGATWIAGRFGSALLFDRVNDLVTVGDSNLLDLTGAMTIEAWVYPRPSSSWRSILLKERSGNLAYALYGKWRYQPPVSGDRDGDGEFRCARARAAAAGEHVDASRGDVRRDDGPAVQKWNPGRHPGGKRHDRHLIKPVADWGQQHVG